MAQVSFPRVGEQQWPWLYSNDTGNFFAELSDFGSTDPQCPKCNSVILHGQLKPETDREGEVTSWYGECECGTKLRILND